MKAEDFLKCNKPFVVNIAGRSTGKMMDITRCYLEELKKQDPRIFQTQYLGSWESAFNKMDIPTKDIVDVMSIGQYLYSQSNKDVNLKKNFPELVSKTFTPINIDIDKLYLESKRKALKSMPLKAKDIRRYLSR